MPNWPRRGAVGRASADFAAARDSAGDWRLHALEINLRKGGTTHPYAALRNLVPGHYDPDAGRWVTDRDGSARAYRSTDNVVDPAWTGRPPSSVIDAIRRAGLQFDPERGTGVVLHMLSCLAVDGRFGATAIGTSPAHADELFEGMLAAVAHQPHRQVGRSPTTADPQGSKLVNRQPPPTISLDSGAGDADMGGLPLRGRRHSGASFCATVAVAPALARRGNSTTDRSADSERSPQQDRGVQVGLGGDSPASQTGSTLVRC